MCLYRWQEDVKIKASLNLPLSESIHYNVCQGLLFENSLYKYMKEKILTPNINFNFIGYVASGSCPRQKIKNFLKRIISKYK